MAGGEVARGSDGDGSALSDARGVLHVRLHVRLHVGLRGAAQLQEGGALELLLAPRGALPLVERAPARLTKG